MDAIRNMNKELCLGSEHRPTLREVLEKRKQDAAIQIEQASRLLEALPSSTLSMEIYDFYRLIGV